MARGASPLRYPGGKTALASLLAKIIKINGLERVPYAEPFAGGGGLALSLLYSGYVSRLFLNDVDAGIWAFWHSVLNNNEKFCYMVAKTPVTVEEWTEQRAIYLEEDVSDPIRLGFANFFLNRTNRSGIIKGGGIIGGKGQEGRYTIDCRFNKDDLIRRIRRVEKYRDRISLYRRDALSFMAETIPTLPLNTFVCVDPPYYKKGSILYTSFYRPSDHKHLSDCIQELSNPWIVTYDCEPEIEDLYRNRRVFDLPINYSAEVKKLASELLISSDRILIPRDLRQRHPIALSA